MKFRSLLSCLVMSLHCAGGKPIFLHDPDIYVTLDSLLHIKYNIYNITDRFEIMCLLIFV